MTPAAAIIAALAAIFVAFMARELKISEFRQAWINGLRDEISEYTTKAHEWMELYLDTNPCVDQVHKDEMYRKLNALKYESFRAYRKIQMRFKPDDEAADKLLASLLDLLDPSKSGVSASSYGAWRDHADNTILAARHLLKKEWETTKSPLGRISRKLKSTRTSA